jgi:(1->4)-alpha-D-glucan 1-alpha-D-glucosylmutase
VGGHPEQFGVSLEGFHAYNAERARHWPHSLLALSTHDTKRSADVRARINVLSELAQEWERAVRRWREWHTELLAGAGRQQMPSLNDQYLFYQTLVGAWPGELSSPEQRSEFRQRMSAYMQKATKEAKVHTSWINPDEGYDEAVRLFVEGVLGAEGKSPFESDFSAFQKRVSFFGRVNSLVQVLLELTSPGVPDIYQGSELWDYSLVDPDNRRPVDFALRSRLLAELDRDWSAVPERRTLASRLLAEPAAGRIKLFLIWRLLALRRRLPDLFARGSYEPLRATGEKGEHVCAFARSQGEQRIVVVGVVRAARLMGGEERLPIGAVWGDERLPVGEEKVGSCYQNVLTEECVRVDDQDGVVGLRLREVLAQAPLAVLERCEPEGEEG